MNENNSATILGFIGIGALILFGLIMFLIKSPQSAPVQPIQPIQIQPAPLTVQPQRPIIIHDDCRPPHHHNPNIVIPPPTIVIPIGPSHHHDHH